MLHTSSIIWTQREMKTISPVLCRENCSPKTIVRKAIVSPVLPGLIAPNRPRSWIKSNGKMWSSLSNEQVK